jgi:hypothetical protein
MRAVPPYQEAHSALSWPLLACGLIAPLGGAVACVILAITVNPLWLLGIVFVVLIAPCQVYISLLYRSWPTGIRIDKSAISIGAVRSGRAARRTPTVTHQSWGLFTCPRPAVQGARVVTDPAELRQIRQSPRYATLTSRRSGTRGMTRCQLGVLTSPFMRAALVIDVDIAAVTAPQARPARLYSNGMNGRFSRRVEPELSPTWIVPTRDPEGLSQALQRQAR